MKNVVEMNNSVYQTGLGNYFTGQTGDMIFGKGLHAWGALINPTNSGVDLFWNVYTISNYSSVPFTAEMWLNTRLPEVYSTSTLLSSPNETMEPPSKPLITLHFSDRTRWIPTEGIFSFVRRVPPRETLTRHDFQGMIVIPPGGNILVFLKSPGSEEITGRIAFGWWESGNTRR